MRRPRDFTRVTIRSYRNFDPKLFQNHINSIDWSNILAIDDPSTAAETFTTMFSDILDLHAPFKSVKLRLCAPPWINTDYLAHIDEREFLSKRYKKFPRPENLALKKDASYRTNKLKYSIQRSYFQEAVQCNKNDMNAMWKT